MGFIPVIAVLAVNTILKTVLFLLVKFEKHFTVSAELAATAFKLFCAQVRIEDFFRYGSIELIALLPTLEEARSCMVFSCRGSQVFSPAVVLPPGAQFLNTSIIVFAVSSSAINEAATVEGLPEGATSASTREFEIKW